MLLAYFKSANLQKKWEKSNLFIFQALSIPMMVISAYCGVSTLSGILPSAKTQYSPRAGGIETQLVRKIKSSNPYIIQQFRTLEEYII